jgi:hypothetical protein
MFSFDFALISYGYESVVLPWLDADAITAIQSTCGAPLILVRNPQHIRDEEKRIVVAAV